MRRTRLAAAAAAVVTAALSVAACGSSTASSSSASSGGNAASGSGSTTIKVGVAPVSDFLALNVALAKGYFSQEGLTVKPTPIANGAAGAAAVQGGSLNITFSSVIPLAEANSHGASFRFFSGDSVQEAGHWNQALVVPSSSSAKTTGQALKAGSTIAMNDLSDPGILAVHKLAKENGVSPSSLKIVEVSFPDQLQALKAGRVAAAVEIEPFVTLGTTSGSLRVVNSDPYSALGSKVFIGGYYATSQWLSANTATASKFNSAIQKAEAFIQQNPTAARAILAKSTKVPAKVADKMQLPSLGISSKDTSALQTTITAGISAGLLPKGMQASSLLEQ